MDLRHSAGSTTKLQRIPADLLQFSHVTKSLVVSARSDATVDNGLSTCAHVGLSLFTRVFQFIAAVVTIFVYIRPDVQFMHTCFNHTHSVKCAV